MMADALMGEVDALNINGGISVADREQQTAELRERLLDLERVEEAIVEAAAEQGQDIPRRPGASPLAVLGVRAQPVFGPGTPASRSS
jgi:hypothetical protein